MSHPMELRTILSDLIFYNFRGSLFYFYLVRFVSSFFFTFTLLDLLVLYYLLLQTLVK